MTAMFVFRNRLISNEPIPTHEKDPLSGGWLQLRNANQTPEEAVIIVIIPMLRTCCMWSSEYVPF